MPGFLVHHQLPDPAQTHVWWCASFHINNYFISSFLMTIFYLNGCIFCFFLQHILVSINECLSCYCFTSLSCYCFSRMVLFKLLLQVASVVPDSVRPRRRQPTRLPRPWDSPGKNTGVGCHFLLQCMKVKSESEVAQSLFKHL